MHSPLILIAAIGLAGIACQWLAWRVGIPAIVFLLIAGILAGPVTRVLDPDALFGELLFPLVSLGVAVILFEGSLTLKLRQVRDLEGVVRNLVTVGALVTGLVVAAAAHWLLDLPWGLALLFGAIMTVTGPTVIKPLLRSARPKAHVGHVLQWEGIILDPLGALLTVLVFEFVASGHGREGPWLTFGAMVGVGTAFGVAGAWILAALLRRHLLPHYLHHVFALVFVLGIYALADSLEHESGLLAVTLMGMLLANMKGVDVEDILFFKESLSLLFISVLFIVLAARLEPAQVLGLGWPALALFAVLVLVARPLSVWLSTLGSGLARNERLLLAWLAPRGIVAAAVSALFALRLEEAGYPGAEVLVPLTFLMIIGTVGLQSFTARPLAERLGVAEPEPKGCLIVGANRFARALGLALERQGFPARLTDTSWEHVSAARMAGLQTYFGSVVSEHAEHHLDMAGIGRVLALSPDPAANALACGRFKYELGPGNLFRIRTAEDEQTRSRLGIAGAAAGQPLFGDDITYAKLASLTAQGAEIHTTALTEDFDYQAYLRRYRNRAIVLFALDKDGRLRLFTAAKAPEPAAGWRLTALLPEEVLEEPKASLRDHQADTSAERHARATASAD